MGIPLYREQSALAPFPQVKLPAACPYAASLTHAARRHHHHRPGAGTHQQELPVVAVAAAAADPDLLALESRGPETRTATAPLSPSSSTSSSSTSSPAAISRHLWRQMPRVHNARERATAVVVVERPTESHERSTAAPATLGRYTQRIVRSPPGTREFEDEHRAAELVDLYFQELGRIRASSSQQSAGGQQQQRPNTSASVEDGVRARTNTERVMDLVARRQRRSEASHESQQQQQQQQPSPTAILDRHSMHEALVRQQHRTQRAPRVVQHLGAVVSPDSGMMLDQEMQEVEYESP